MVTVRFLPDNRSASIEQGSTILEAARQAGVLIEAPCNGAGHCAKCLVRLPGDDLANVVVHVDAPVDAGPDMVLACHSHVFGDVTVETVQREETGLQVQCAGQAGDVDLLPYITKNYHAGADRTAVLAGDRLLGFEQGDTTTATYGLVVDIGTTTLVAAVVDLNSGAELAGASRLNPQSLHAQDVLSRIRFAADGGLEVLHRELIRELNAIIAEAASAATIPADRIYEAVFSGNTCMLHLAAGIDPAPLGRHPFTLVIRGGCHIGASDIGLAIAPAGIVYLPPVISAYVGADISAGMLASGLADLPGNTLFIDIGTNGELALAADGVLLASATAAGPAFEGMNISCGMRAAVGAIERVELAPDGELELGVIGAVEPAGICGSGLMDLVAVLVEQGAILPSGKLNGSGTLFADLIEKTDAGSVFRLSRRVAFSQKDVRQVQLSKGAIRAGIELLLERAGLGPGDLDRVLIAGSFGYHLRERSLISIGLLPPEAEGKVAFLGNTSRSGGEMLLLDHRLRPQLQDVVERVTVVDLAGDPTFERAFMAAMKF
ncbi:ASKHA domain-containing protein [Geobacter sp. SVR]|uniref:ASKHA domain-containing protein n=1 Tax=Geobacter sp. SVR TaxID=2495594 RepID=UPI00143EF4AE|nr:ASKHA domain-containing protein [Geobacter sp. SVR]BCS54147.1 hypothetical protein GSVR_24550 [Geobacter sp. SVR]GCF87709.1 hypothetical protein GSbR_43090 [Geobacter sp. SVR]